MIKSHQRSRPSKYKKHYRKTSGYYQQSKVENAFYIFNKA